LYLFHDVITFALHRATPCNTTHGSAHPDQARTQESREAGKQGSREAGKQGSRDAGKQGSREAGKQGSREAGKQGKLGSRLEG
jgi:hypothetical protein